ncbi:sodium leak channel non-selective protein-like [Tropilaelaps mercedesae]|uniref:Sodium leak channel non-selective protein-like n=1 Tax=Tropilaelaps mercedesae TaxID=418985 RepID=A0A1V9Y2E5_9ACAR|nr:sodium leak channel non-selective protein-like [Tropilaelaps mercedesae]
MLARKQSVKGGTEPILADYGPDESFNESADIDWVNKAIANRLRPPRSLRRSHSHPVHHAHSDALTYQQRADREQQFTRNPIRVE